MRKAAFLQPFLALLFISAGFGQSTQDYIRFLPGATPEDGELQVAVESYTLHGVQVDLYGVVHMADRAYYESINRDFTAYDVVLYEGVRRGTEPNIETKGLNLIQQGMAKLLGVEFQMKEIDYSAPNMVHADIDIEALQERLGDQQLSPIDGLFSPAQIRQIEPLIQTLGGFLDTYLEANPEIRTRFKLQFAEQLSSTDIEAQLPPQMKQAILDDRNDIVMEALGQQLQDPVNRKIAIFYGAGHNPDFSRRFLRAGWNKGTKTWKTAWTIGRGATEAPPATPKRVAGPKAPLPSAQNPATAGENSKD